MKLRCYGQFLLSLHFEMLISTPEKVRWSSLVALLSYNKAEFKYNKLKPGLGLKCNCESTHVSISFCQVRAKLHNGSRAQIVRGPPIGMT